MHRLIPNFFKLVALSVIVSLLITTAGMLYLNRLEGESDQKHRSPSPYLAQDTLPHQPITEKPAPLKLIFTGDVMLDRHIRTNAERYGYDSLIDENLRHLLLAADYVVINLEGPITTNPSVSVNSAVGSTNNFIFTFDPEVTQFLQAHNLKIVNLGNNHILNFGEGGLMSTYQYLEEANLTYFGNTGPAATDSQRVAIIEHGDLKIGFVNYNQFVAAGLETAMSDLAQLKPQVDLIFVYPHWGNEYVKENEVLINQAHQLIDAGADAIIGSHPHVVTGREDYQARRIYYSLGNFIFDQYFEPAVREGMIVEVLIEPVTHQLHFQEHMVEMTKDGKSSLKKTSNNHLSN